MRNSDEITPQENYLSGGSVDIVSRVYEGANLDGLAELGIFNVNDCLEDDGGGQESVGSEQRKGDGASVVDVLSRRLFRKYEFHVPLKSAMMERPLLVVIFTDGLVGSPINRSKSHSKSKAHSV